MNHEQAVTILEGPKTAQSHLLQVIIYCQLCSQKLKPLPGFCKVASQVELMNNQKLSEQRKRRSDSSQNRKEEVN